MSRVAILGAGAWGRALAATAVRAHHQVSVWARNLEKWTPLKGNEGPLEVTLYSDLGDVLAAADGIIFALPAQTVRSFLTQNPLPVRPLLFGCKGIEGQTGFFLSEVLEDLGLPHPVGFLGGPHLATEVVQGLPTAGTIGAFSLELAQFMSSLLHHSGFHITACEDPLGVQVVGALKNVFAVLGGLILGAGLGENARSALLTEGFGEINRLGQWVGASEKTLWSQAGLGDFMLTCLSLHSRNTQFGLRLARGENPSPHDPLAEGFFTTHALQKRAHENHLSLPLVARLSDILNSPEQASTLIPSLMECLS